MLAPKPAVLPSSSAAPAPRQTAWLTVLLAICAGMLAAFQVGKAYPALPSIRRSFSLGLVSASWIFSALNVVGLFAATPAGTICGRIGNKKSVVVGTMLIAIASTYGGFAPTLSRLLLSRLIEGIGFVIVVVAAPSLIVEVTSPKDLRLALAGWAAYMPGGIALVTMLAPLALARHTWRTVWWSNSVLLAVIAIVVAMFAKQKKALTHVTSMINPWSELRSVMTARGPLLLSIIFGMYTMQHLSIMGFMPTILSERFHLSETRVGILVSVAMASNVIGNLAAGVMLQRGVHRTHIISVTSIFMAFVTASMFILHLPLSAFYLCAFAFSCVGGLIPSAVVGAAPFYAPSPPLIDATNGLLVQGSNLGIVLGPPLMGSIATRFGWNWVPAMTVVAALIATVLANNLQSGVLLRAGSQSESFVD